MTQIEDLKQRLQALDPTKSFIIQAPAGSGKTELLTRRFLTLLSQVNQPEEILAMTFTKKAAAEMRSRILAVLSERDHPADYAQSALLQNKIKGWDLLENPNRLRIQTIDSFNSSLTRQLPILSHFGSPPEIEPQPEYLYREAILQFISQLEDNAPWSDAIEQLLKHLDNDLLKLEALLMSMLKKRDQWLPSIASYQPDFDLRKKLESHLQNMTKEILFKLETNFPSKDQNELIELINFGCTNLQKINAQSNILACEKLTKLPTATLKDLPLWMGIKEFLFTNPKNKLKDFKWRERIDINIGFPPKKVPGAENMKQRMESLIETLIHYDEKHNHQLKKAFDELHLIPNYLYDENQWQMLQALQTTLQILAAQLRLVFQQYGKIDYIENAQAALFALGDLSTPTDLALALDYRIQHILVDEFQDTSSTQFQLLEKLTFGWQEGDGRTLFLVGDPMQSIYRFREADVSLFLQARNHGLNSIHLQPLTLRVNFRSKSTLIEWVNSAFKKILPAEDDISEGAISYSPSTYPLENTASENAVHIHPCINQSQFMQAQAVIVLIKSLLQKNPHEKIAILVRARSHLAFIISILQQEKIAYQAIEIEKLLHKTIIEDLLTLTKALLNLSDRTAWLSLLRAPWCGLTLADLHVIAHEKKCTIYERLTDSKILQDLSEDGQSRVKRIVPFLELALNQKFRQPLRQWLEETWINIGGPACAATENQLEDALTFFTLLESLDAGKSHFAISLLEESLSQLFASSKQHHACQIQIMTIHSAKGLEFDNVILPYLEAASASDKEQILLWMKHSTKDHVDELIMAPLHATGKEEDKIYQFIKRKQAQKTSHEMSRLLYVAVTRAKKRLDIFFNLKKEDDEETFSAPKDNSLLAKLSRSLNIHNFLNLTDATPLQKTLAHTDPIQRNLKRFKSNWQSPLTLDVHQDNPIHQKVSGIMLPDHSSQLIGILIHKFLENIGRFGVEWWTQITTQNQITYINNKMNELRFLSNNRDKWIKFVLASINNTLCDERGRWIFDSHSLAENELKLTTFMNGKLCNYIIDRTFVDKNGIRWIIDYKSGLSAHEMVIHSAEEQQKFIQSAKERYQSQLNQYAHLIREFDEVSGESERPIQVGLYFPLLSLWESWQFEDKMTSLKEKI